MASFVLQKSTDFQETSSHDAYPAVRIEADISSDAEEEESPVPLTFVGIKTEPEVSCISIPMLWDFTNTGLTHFVNPQFMNFCYSEQLVFVSSIFVKS
jgi:hypothetical protein